MPTCSVDVAAIEMYGASLTETAASDTGSAVISTDTAYGFNRTIVDIDDAEIITI